jgi:hypothetical protein
MSFAIAAPAGIPPRLVTAHESRKDLLFLLQGLVVFADEVADLVRHPKELFPLFSIKVTGKRPSPYTDRAPFWLTLSDICPLAGFFRASFSVRSRSISAFKSSSEVIGLLITRRSRATKAGFPTRAARLSFGGDRQLSVRRRSFLAEAVQIVSRADEDILSRHGR